MAVSELKGVIMKVKGFLLVGAAGVAASPGAQAADLQLKAPAMAPAPISWTGLYLGVSAGAAFQSHSDTYGYGIFFDPVQNTATTTGFIGGGQIGYNFQSGAFVYGVEGDFSGLTGKTHTRGLAAPFLAGGNYTGQISWLATARGRVGVAIGDTMPYFTAGVAFTRVNHLNAAPPGNDPNGTYSDTSVRTGLVLGGGIEHMITRNWTVKFEGLWVDAGEKIVGANVPSFGSSPGAKTTKFSDHVIIARAGLNYKF
jgi:outer membrane immunogenic protein